MLSRVLPFALYLFFLMLAEGISWLAGRMPTASEWEGWAQLWLYPIKTVVVSAALITFWPTYQELKDSPFESGRDLMLAVSVGILVYLAWIHADWAWATLGQSRGYNPYAAGEGTSTFLAATRLIGAAAVVPVMEELFWRSFLLRYLISSRFEAVPLGTFTLFSFVATLVLFGLEHHLWLAGMIAGAAYTLLLYWTRRLWPSVIAHAVTNLGVGIHVLTTKEWNWW
jgi:CAAX prenyl protease-like protein